MKNVKSIIVFLLSFGCCFLILDYCIGLWLDRMRQNLPIDGERTAKAEYVINNVKADVIIVGSSRAQAHYDTAVLRDSFPDMSVFNCGGDGQKFWYCDIVTNCIFNRYTPKLIIWDFLLQDLESDNENLSLLYPYYKENSYIKERLLELDPMLKYQLWLNSYRYNGSGSRIVTASRLPKDNGRDKLGYSGHEPLKTISMIFDELRFKYVSPDNKKLAHLESTIQKAQSKGIRLVFTISPVVNKIIGKNTTIECLRELSLKYGITFIDDSQLENFVGCPERGYDSNHLNCEAARAFTAILISQMQNIEL